MPVGELYINKDANGNWQDAYIKWGISFDQTALSTLMTPPPNKAYIENKSRLENGKRIILHEPKVDERSITISFNLTAKDSAQFFERYNSFCEELAKGELHIKTAYQEGVVYKMVYESCTQFSQLMREIARFSLKLVEPNPSDRE